jgi:hypothetical protein
MLRWPVVRIGARQYKEQGSAVLLVLLVCLAAAVVVQTASLTLLLAERALADESVGRQRLQ